MSKNTKSPACPHCGYAYEGIDAAGLAEMTNVSWQCDNCLKHFTVCSTNEIEKAFEEWERTYKADPDATCLDDLRVAFKAGAEAKAQSMTATELSERVHLRERADYAAAIKAERKRVLKEVRQFIMRQSWSPDWQNKREYELLCEVKRALLEAIQELEEAE